MNFIILLLLLEIAVKVEAIERKTYDMIYKFMGVAVIIAVLLLILGALFYALTSR